MPAHSHLSTSHVLSVFTEEIAVLGGCVTNTFHDDQRLFTRSVLPEVEDVRPGDGFQRGVALKAVADGLWLYPYLFRLVCQNGAIIAETLESRFLGDLHQEEPEVAVASIRETITACCAPELFLNNVRKMRTAGEKQADVVLNFLPFISQLMSSASASVIAQVMKQFFREGDQSQYGLANAVTAVARETHDPDLRWNLEELGGGIAVGTLLRDPTDERRAALSQPECAVC